LHTYRGATAELLLVIAVAGVILAACDHRVGRVRPIVAHMAKLPALLSSTVSLLLQTAPNVPQVADIVKKQVSWGVESGARVGGSS